MSQYPIRVIFLAFCALSIPFQAQAEPLLERLLSEKTNIFELNESALQEFSRLDEKSKAALVPGLIEALKSTDTFTQRKAAEALRAAGTLAEAAIPELIRILDGEKGHSDRLARATAADALGAMGALAQEAAPMLFKILSERLEDTLVLKPAVAQALARIAPNHSDTLPALIALLNTHDDDDWFSQRLREGAILGLAEAARTRNDILPAVAEALKGPGRADAAQFMVWQGTAAVPYLAAALHSNDGLAREWSAQALFWLGPQAKDAFKDMVSALDDEIFTVRKKAAAALERTGLPEAGEILEEYRKTERARIREKFARAKSGNIKGLVITLGRYGRIGYSHELIIHGDGRVLFGYTGSGEKEEKERIAPGKVRELLEEFEKADFFFLKVVRLKGECADGPSTWTSLFLDEKTSTDVLDHCGVIAPEGLASLDAKIDEIGGTKRWSDAER